jgi:transcriptional regulator with XRE-family HTH domain
MNANKIMRILRETNGYTAEYIASELGVSQETYSQLEAGQMRLTIDNLAKLAGLYSIDAECFLWKDAYVVNYNIGANSHGGPIESYNNCNNDIIKKLYDQILNEKEDKIRLLQAELDHKRQEIDKLVSVVEEILSRHSS